MVQRHSIGSETIFRITFSDSRRPLVITRATHENAYRFWTSIPEGRQWEAEEIGPRMVPVRKTRVAPRQSPHQNDNPFTR